MFLPGCCKFVELSTTEATYWGPYVGTYKDTGEEQEGAPVYRRWPDAYLARHSDGIWRASRYIDGSSYYRSVGAAECPASINQWQYRDDLLIWRSGDVSVECVQLFS